jgi:hypothetical protein
MASGLENGRTSYGMQGNPKIEGRGREPDKVSVEVYALQHFKNSL